MGDFSQIGAGPSAFDEGFVLANTGGTTVTASGTINTKGSYIELVSAVNNTQASRLLKIQFTGRATASEFLLDIALGEAGSEKNIIDNIWVFTSLVGEAGVFELEYAIPSGVRISARCQSNDASAAIKVSMSRAAGSFSQSKPLSRIATVGANTTTTSGIEVARTTAGAWGSWVEITPSLTNSAKGFIVAAHKEGMLSWSTFEVAYQVAVGSAGNEVVISPTIILSINANETMSPPISSFMPIGIASGERVSIRASGESANSDLDLNYIMYFVD